MLKTSVIKLCTKGAYSCTLPSVSALKVKGQGQMLRKSDHFQGSS